MRNGEDMTENEISRVIIDAAIEVHRELGGPGLLDLKLAMVINFGKRRVSQGVRRVVNGLEEGEA